MNRVVTGYKVQSVLFDIFHQNLTAQWSIKKTRFRTSVTSQFSKLSDII